MKKISLIVFFFFSQENLDFKPCVDRIIFATIYLSFDFLFILEFIQCLYAFLDEPVKLW